MGGREENEGKRGEERGRERVGEGEEGRRGGEGRGGEEREKRE